MGIDDLLRRTLDKYKDLGKPGPVLPWSEDDHGGWARILAGTDRVVAMVDEYPPNLGKGYFYVVGDGETEVSSDKSFETAEAAKDAADVRLLEIGYTFQGAN